MEKNGRRCHLICFSASGSEKLLLFSHSIFFLHILNLLFIAIVSLSHAMRFFFFLSFVFLHSLFKRRLMYSDRITTNRIKYTLHNIFSISIRWCFSFGIFTETMQTDKKSQQDKEENNYFWHLGFSSSVYARARAVNLNSTACGKRFPFSILSFIYVSILVSILVSFLSFRLFIFFYFYFVLPKKSRYFSVGYL